VVNNTVDPVLLRWINRHYHYHYHCRYCLLDAVVVVVVVVQRCIYCVRMKMIRIRCDQVVGVVVVVVLSIPTTE